MKLYGGHSVKIKATYTWNYLQKIHVNILFYQLTLTKIKSLIKNAILLIVTNSLTSCITYLCTFGFSSQSFYYLNLIRFCDLFIQGNSPVLALLHGNCPDF